MAAQLFQNLMIGKNGISVKIIYYIYFNNSAARHQASHSATTPV